MRIAHLSDTHIRNLKYHEEYKQIFEKIYKILREENVDVIVHCGDIAHTKTQISPEFVDMCSSFLKNLADIAPLFVIRGNHDANCRNLNRLDALTPIVKTLKHPNINLLVKSGEVKFAKPSSNEEVVFNLLDILDKDNWKNPSDESKINIALHHGSISGCQTDIGWTMEHAENEVGIFEKFDYALLGDIHKTNQILDDDGRCRYAGSTIQQNHGETNDKGFLIWDIQSKKDFNVRHIAIPNPKPFISLNLTKLGKIPKDAVIPPRSRLRLVSEHNLPLDTIRKAIDVAKKNYDIESVSYLNKSQNKRANLDELIGDFKKEDLRDLVTQERLIKEFLKEYSLKSGLMEEILELNKKYNLHISDTNDTCRNIDFEILELQWDNLFNYGEKNKINFSNKQGILGLFGKAYSGKSSVLDSLMFTIYNTIGKNNPGGKTINIINRDSDWCRGYVKLRIANKEYTIERKAEKYTKRLHGEETVEAKMTLDFFEHDLLTGETISLNGERRQDTDSNIVKLFGSAEDFFITTMYHQFGTNTFIDAKSTERKKIFAKFLDLEPFEKKYKLANEDSRDLKAILKKLEDADYDKEIEETQRLIKQKEQEIYKQKAVCELTKEEISSINEKISKLDLDIKNAPSEFIDIENLEEMIASKNKKIDKISKDLDVKKKFVGENKTSKQKIELFLKNFDIDSLEKDKLEILAKNELLKSIEIEKDSAVVEATHLKNRINILDNVPCGDKFPTCPFIRDAHNAKKNIENILVLIKDKELLSLEISKEIKDRDLDKIEREIKEYYKIVSSVKEIELDIAIEENALSKLEVELQTIKNDIVSLLEKKKKYLDNKETIENIAGILKIRDELILKLKEKKLLLSNCESRINFFFKEHGSLEHKLESLIENRNELQKTRSTYEAYDLYLKCMHPNGIAYDIVKKSLPAINKELSTILTSIIDMDVYFENEGDNLKIYFQRHSDSGPIPLELGSGTQKSLAAMAIRLALVGISSLPKSDMFILDEPGTMLDADNMEGFIRILELIKSIYNRILLITHLDPLKDTADIIISISERDDRAYINI